MKFNLANNTSAFNRLKTISSDYTLPFNSGKRVGYKQAGIPNNAAPASSNVSLTEWLNYKIASGAISIPYPNPTIQTGAVAPTLVVPAYVGQVYHDTVAGILYMADGLTAGDWLRISNV